MMAASIGPEQASPLLGSSFGTIGTLYEGACSLTTNYVLPGLSTTVDKVKTLWDLSLPILTEILSAAQTKLGVSIVLMILAIPMFSAAGATQRGSPLTIALLAGGVLLTLGAGCLLHASGILPSVSVFNIV